MQALDNAIQYNTIQKKFIERYSREIESEALKCRMHPLSYKLNQQRWNRKV